MGYARALENQRQKTFQGRKTASLAQRRTAPRRECATEKRCGLGVNCQGTRRAVALSHEENQTTGGPLSRPFPSRSYGPREPLHRRNGKIRAREVRVLDETKQALGVMSLTDALRLAQSRNMDLIEIAPTATPPVCRIIQYGKFQYEESKKKKDSQARQATGQMKELQLSANIDPHDFRTKVNHAIEFLCDDLKVRIKLRFRGRQRAHKEFGFEVVNKFIQETAPYGRVDAAPKMAGDRDLHALISPLPREQRAKPPKKEPAPATPDTPAPPATPTQETKEP
jgi:translation initiation factor IF-3